MVNILQPMPKTCPSARYSIAEAATELAKPVMGTSPPAPPNFHGGIENKLPERTDQSSGQKCFYHVKRQTVRGGDAAYIFFVAFLIFFISFGSG